VDGSPRSDEAHQEKFRKFNLLVPVGIKTPTCIVT